MILDEFPSVDEFYTTYWGRKPFVVRGAIAPAIFDDLIDGDHLAGLALEEDVKSRIVTTGPQGGAWSCEYGPFSEDHFSTLGEKNWSLLVQNVERYHCDTAKLLQYFDFSPRWLMDDIMVSYSTKGGSVGPHTDSYHVFLVQGIGKRQWKISHSPIEQEDYIEGMDLKVLKQGFEGEEVEVVMGDVIYIPPHFAHEGITYKEAMTFSVGFLGPTMSELLIEYGYYIERDAHLNQRYSGQGLDKRSAGFTMHADAQKSVQNSLVDVVKSDLFSRWMMNYFLKSESEDEERDI